LKFKLNKYKSALLMSALFLTICNVFGQNSVLELLPGSETLEYDQKTGIHRLKGNVNFTYQGNTMYCDSALYFQKQNAVRAYGNVQVNKKDINLFCDSLYYNGTSRSAKLWGNVRVRDNEYKLTTDTLEYNAKNGQAYYLHGGKVEGIVSRETLTSKVGYFHPETKNFFFSNNVKYRSSELQMDTDTLKYLYSNQKTFFEGPTVVKTQNAIIKCESGWYDVKNDAGFLRKKASIVKENESISADTLIYQPKIGLSEGYGNVKYIDTLQKVEFSGNHAKSSDSLKYSFITGKAIAKKILANDTLYVHADTLYNYTDNSGQIKAYHGAKIFSSTFQCISDSIVYTPDSNFMELYHSPVAWANLAQLKGDFIKVYLNDSTIKSALIDQKASVVMEVEKGIYYNQIYGQEIKTAFLDNQVKTAYVNGNAMTISFPQDNQQKDSIQSIKRLGMNRLYSSQLRIDVDSNEITGVNYINKPDGAFYPMDQLNEEEHFIPNFKWLEALRPKSLEDLFID